MPLPHVNGDYCSCCINFVEVMRKYLPDWSPINYVQFLEVCEINPVPGNEPVRGLIEDMIVMSNMMNGTPGREWKVFSEPTPPLDYHDHHYNHSTLAAGRRAAKYVQGLPPRIVSINGITLEDGGDTSFPNN